MSKAECAGATAVRLMWLGVELLSDTIMNVAPGVAPWRPK